MQQYLIKMYLTANKQMIKYYYENKRDKSIIFLMKMFKKKVLYLNCLLMFCLYNCHCNKMLSLNYYWMYRGNIPDILNWKMQFALKETVINKYILSILKSELLNNVMRKIGIIRKKIKIGLRQSLVLSSLPSKSCL